MFTSQNKHKWPQPLGLLRNVHPVQTAYSHCKLIIKGLTNMHAQTTLTAQTTLGASGIGWDQSLAKFLHGSRGKSGASTDFWPCECFS